MSKIFETLKIAITGKEKNFTSGNINRAIILLSIPMILEMLMEGLFAIVDAYWVGKISTEAMAVVGYTESVITIVYSLAFGMAMAATAMVARRIGEEKHEEAAKVSAQAILISSSVAILAGILGYVFAADILSMMGASEAEISTGLGFTQIIFSTNIVIVSLFVFNGIFRGAGDASSAMWALWISNGLNIILDPIFIFGWGPIPEFGVAGAAIATTLGRGIGVGFQLYILFGGKLDLKLKRAHFTPIFSIIKKFVDIASTGSIQFIIASSSWIFLMKIISQFGTDVVAGYWLAIRIIMFTILPSWGLANAAATLVGQNLGAKKPERAEKSVWLSAIYNVIFLTIVGIILFAFSRPIVGLFVEDIVVIEVSILALRIFAIGYLFFAAGMVLGQAFNGAGDTRTPTYVNFICFWVLQIPMAYLFAIEWEWGPSGVYWTVAISEAVLALILAYLFRKGKWKTVEV